MNNNAKQLHIKKVFSQKPILPTENVNPPHSFHALSVSVDDCGLTNIAQDTLQGKAESLVKCNGHIIKAPWISDEKARLVKSSSTLSPTW